MTMGKCHGFLTKKKGSWPSGVTSKSHLKTKKTQNVTLENRHLSQVGRYFNHNPIRTPSVSIVVNPPLGASGILPNYTDGLKRLSSTSIILKIKLNPGTWNGGNTYLNMKALLVSCQCIKCIIWNIPCAAGCYLFTIFNCFLIVFPWEFVQKHWGLPIYTFYLKGVFKRGVWGVLQFQIPNCIFSILVDNIVKQLLVSS